MIHSMTGFGEAQLEEAGYRYYLEIRSVNNRFFKPSIRQPEDFAFLESEVERLLHSRLSRGSVTMRLHVHNLSAAAAEEINTAAVQHYIRQLRQAAPPDDPNLTIDLATLATLPGVCQPRELTGQEREHAWAIVSKLLESALEQLVSMRAKEGQTLAADLKAHAECIGTQLDLIRQRAGLVVEEYRQRLAARVQQLIASSNVQLAEEDLVREVAIYAERSDISEELTRLAGHLEHFDGALNSAEPAGRKLEFIAQEMLREANTIGSKAGDPEIARQTIEIKGAIDRIKEQVQNAE
ncbi:MAG: YicC family protein [Planctomycetes bacterium]|nr:YicC family protein [Planctomycetota bacterium]